jgi:ABC-2 type transport system ATP-binding protein
VPETSNIYDEMSAIDNLIFAGKLYNVTKSERIKRAEDFLRKFGLYDRKRKHVGNFSRGMKRRVTIAAALIHKPDLLFLDEPTTGLDVQSTRLIRSLLKELNEDGVSIFLTTHYIEEADQLCDRVSILKNGKIIKVDTPEQLKQSIESYNAIEVAFNKTDDFLYKLERLNNVKKVMKIGDKFKFFVENPSEFVPIIIDFARENNLKVISINTLRPSLEDAFVKITGMSTEIMTNEKELVKKK